MADPQTRVLTGVDDFGVIQRGPDDVDVCAGGAAFSHAEKCRVIDDAIVYLRNTSSTELQTLMDRASTGAGNYLPNTPPGRLPDFYRAIIGSRLFYQKTLQPPTLRQLLGVMDMCEDTRNRDDDFAMLETATRAILGYKLTPAEQSWADERQQAIAAAMQPPPASSSSSSSGSTGLFVLAGLAVVGLLFMGGKK